MNNKKTRPIFLMCLIWMILSISVYSRVFQLAVKPTNSDTGWNIIQEFSRQKNLPILAVTAKWPFQGSDLRQIIPAPPFRILLETDLSLCSSEHFDSHLNQLKEALKDFPNIKFLVLHDLNWRMEKSLFLLKKVSTAARGVIPGIKLGIGLDNTLKKRDILDQVKAVISNRELRPYFNALYLPSLKLQKRIMDYVFKLSPNLELWQALQERIPPDLKPAETMSAFFDENPFEMGNTSILIIPSSRPGELIKPLSNLASMISLDLYRYTTGTRITSRSGKSRRLNNYIKPADQSVMVFAQFPGPDQLEINLKNRPYREAVIRNLVKGTRYQVPIKKNTSLLRLDVQEGFYSINFIPIERALEDSDYTLSITGTPRPSAAEIIAKVRIWQETLKTKLRSYMARMTSSLRLKIANINESFDLTIKGPIFLERGKPYDWVWKEFYINGVKWKSKKVPKIPLLQPEKVTVLPVDLSLSEEYRYTYVRESRVSGRPAHVISFKPRKVYRQKSSYYGTLWIDKEHYFPLKEHLVQINLKGEVLSNTETRYYRQVGEDPLLQLPVKVKGHQVFSTAGRVMNVEKEIRLEQIKINPSDLTTRREEAYRSDYQMVRDTKVGLRYLVKEKKNQERSVEWKVKKSQLLWVLGGFFDSSLSFPIPLIGINYLNFNLGGKGRQVNILFGGAMLTANFSDPSLFGSKIDLGANLVAIALPFNNTIYRHNQKIEPETVKRWPLKFQINAGFPLGPYLKMSNFIFLYYDHFSEAKKTSEDFTLPRSSFSYGLRSRLTANIKGYKISLWGAIARRAAWQFWGMPENEYYSPQHRNYYRWRFTVAKDFFLSGFKKFHFQLGYYDGLDLDRFSAYRFGFFNELRMHGFMSGVVQANRAYMLNLSYGYNIGNAFRLEISYDSALVTNRLSQYKDTYFSSAAVSGTMNIPGINMICRFEAGLPLVSQGIKGFVLYLVLMKML